MPKSCSIRCFNIPTFIKYVFLLFSFQNTYLHGQWMTVPPFSNWLIHTQKRYCRRYSRLKDTLCALSCEVCSGGELPSAEFTLPLPLPSSIWSVISLHLPLRLPSSRSLFLSGGGGALRVCACVWSPFFHCNPRDRIAPGKGLLCKHTH